MSDITNQQLMDAITGMDVRITCRLDVLEQDFAVLKQDMRELKQDIVEVRKDIVEIKQDMREVKQDLETSRQETRGVNETVVEIADNMFTRKEWHDFIDGTDTKAIRKLRSALGNSQV